MKIVNFRKFRNINFDFGKKITVISGTNGIGKSSLLSLISSTTGTTDKRLNDLPFQPEFDDLFKISAEEKFKNYYLYVDFDMTIHDDYHFTKRISFRDDTKTGRGIRPLPRNAAPIDRDDVTKKQAEIDAKGILQITDSRRVQVPTVYLSLSRLLPLGETDLSQSNISKNAHVYTKDYAKFYAECYNSVFPNSIDPQNIVAYFIEKKLLHKKHLTLAIRNTFSETQSVGQDNLGSIVSAIVDFYALSKSDPDNYHGGILCIDELDSSFHPSAIVAVWNLLQSVSESLDLQIVITSHSLTILKEIIAKQKKDSDNYKLVYFKDSNSPRVSKYSTYKMLKADLFDEIYFKRPKTKIYCEDGKTSDLLKLMLEVATNTKTDVNLASAETDAIDVSLGKNNLQTLMKKDNYFRSVLMVLDGDARLKAELSNDRAIAEDNYSAGFNTVKPRGDNIVFLPGFYPPEIFLLRIVREYANNPIVHSRFWRSLEDVNQELSLMTSSKIQNKFDTMQNVKFDDIHNHDSWWTEIYKFVSQSRLLEDYYSDSAKSAELNEFISHYNRAINAVSNSNASQLI